MIIKQLPSSSFYFTDGVVGMAGNQVAGGNRGTPEEAPEMDGAARNSERQAGVLRIQGRVGVGSLVAGGNQRKVERDIRDEVRSLVVGMGLHRRGSQLGVPLRKG